MKFRSKWGNAIYIVRPTVRIVNHLGIVEMRPGLRAKFDLDNHLFDSEQAQRENGWSDEERIAVEKHLLKSKDYGNGIVLSPGQEVPEELQPLAAKNERVAAKCVHIDFINGEVKQCNEEALPGGDKCDIHREKKGKVVRGMITA